MKIQSINPISNQHCFAVKNNIKENNNQIQKNIDDKELLQDKTYNSLMINFKSAKPSSINLAKLPLDEKLTIMFSQLQFGDVVAVGKNIVEVQKGLKKMVDTFDDTIKKILFIEHGGISVPMAFSRDCFNELKCHNIGKEDIYVAKENQYATIYNEDIWYIENGDVIVNKSQKLPIRTSIPADKMYLAKISYENPELSKVYNYENMLTDKLINQNLETLEYLTKGLLTEQKTEEVKKGLSFSDVGGLDDVIKKLKKGIIYPIKKPFAYEGRTVNKGFILHGPPGTGKTLLARALANEAGVNYVKLNGLEMESKWVGESEENWRTLFSGAKECQPTIIFIDEFDAVARSRGGHDSHGDKVVNQLLTLMDDVEKENQQIYVIAATNKLDDLDSAIVRSKRFSAHIEVPAPDRKGLDKIFDIHTRNENLDKNFDKTKFLDDCYANKYTGADISYLVELAHENCWERNGIYEKMDDDTLQPSDLINITLSQIDFDKALEELAKSRKKQARNPIGYTK